MKKLIAIFALITSAQAFAGSDDIAPTDESVVPSQIEQVTMLQSESGLNPGIRLLQVDNGGSADRIPRRSRFYLTFHRDGRMFDVEGSYLILDQASDLKVIKLSLSAGTIDISYTAVVDEEGNKVGKVSTRINFAEALKEAKDAKESNAHERYNLISKVSLQNIK